MADFGTGADSEPSGQIKKHHSTGSTILISAIFVAAAIAWLFHVPSGIVMTIVGGVVFGITYKN